jgi:hypothetical protein
LGALNRHGRELLPAIEAVVSSTKFEEQMQTAYWPEINVSGLLRIYFEQAHVNGWCAARFLRMLQGTLRNQALTAVYGLWGPLRKYKTISAELYRTWQELALQDPEWTDARETLTESVTDGSLVLISLAT